MPALFLLTEEIVAHFTHATPPASTTPASVCTPVGRPPVRGDLYSSPAPSARVRYSRDERRGCRHFTSADRYFACCDVNHFDGIAAHGVARFASCHLSLHPDLLARWCLILRSRRIEGYADIDTVSRRVAGWKTPHYRIAVLAPFHAVESAVDIEARAGDVEQQVTAIAVVVVVCLLRHYRGAEQAAATAHCGYLFADHATSLTRRQHGIACRPTERLDNAHHLLNPARVVSSAFGTGAGGQQTPEQRRELPCLRCCSAIAMPFSFT